MALVINHVKGDVLNPSSYLPPKHPIVYIVHACNALGVMGAGLALQVKNKRPEAYQAYRKLYENYAASYPIPSQLGRALLGTISLSETIVDNSVVINAITQLKTGTAVRQTDYEAVARVVESLSRVFQPNTQIAIPKNFGCALGGANWEVVLTMFKELLKDTDMTLYVVEYQV